jgi:hypothetical protein
MQDADAKAVNAESTVTAAETVTEHSTPEIVTEIGVTDHVTDEHASSRIRTHQQQQQQQQQSMNGHKHAHNVHKHQQTMAAQLTSDSKESAKVYCGMCEAVPATAWCEECNSGFCMM